jgi:hypothetical protein
MKHKWRWLSFLVVTTLAVTLAVSAGRSTRSVTSSASPAVSAAISHDDPSTADGQMIALHEQMTEQMRVNGTPAMVAMMNADPMWAQMRTVPYLQAQEAHQREINKMLGLGG